VLAGIPLTETDTLSLSLGVDRNQLTTVDGLTPLSLIHQLIDELGPRALFPIFHTNDDGDTDENDLDDDDGIPGTDPLNFGGNRRWNVNTWSMSAGWARDSRNKFFAPTSGSFQRVGAEVALPGSDFEYWKLNYEYGRYFPIATGWSILTRGELGYGDGYGNNKSLPFYQNFYAGGVRSVRGFEDNTLGPTENLSSVTSSFLQPLGGSFKTVGSVELIFPTPFSKVDSDTSQFSAFVDVGNVFQDYDAFEVDELRASTGLSFKWQAPVGPIVINLVTPLKKKDGDRTESIQFSFGNQF
jgi:outer membrane protein insertion porin family